MRGRSAVRQNGQPHVRLGTPGFDVGVRGPNKSPLFDTVSRMYRNISVDNNLLSMESKRSAENQEPESNPPKLKDVGWWLGVDRCRVTPVLFVRYLTSSQKQEAIISAS